MPRRYFKRYVPDHDKIREHKHLRLIRPLLNDPNLLHLNRRSISGAVAVGLFVAFIPVPFQMILAAIAAVLIRVNLPISVGMVWISNPITMPPLFYFAYKVGTWILGVPESDFQFELSFEWLSHGLSTIWQPFLLGCLITGTTCALVGGLSVRMLWRLKVQQLWKQRKRLRENIKAKLREREKSKQGKNEEKSKDLP